MLQTTKQHLIFIAFSTLLAGFSTGSIIAFTDPDNAGLATLAFLYLSIFLTVLGLSVFAGLSLREWLTENLYILNVQTSLRQGTLIALLVTVSLLVSSRGLLFWWVEASLILLLAAVELFFSLKL